jgi:hypothetical protein
MSRSRGWFATCANDASPSEEAIEDGGAMTRGEQLGDEGRPDVARAAGDRFLRRIDPNDASYAEPLSVPALLTVLVRTGVSTY